MSNTDPVKLEIPNISENQNNITAITIIQRDQVDNDNETGIAALTDNNTGSELINTTSTQDLTSVEEMSNNNGNNNNSGSRRGSIFPSFLRSVERQSRSWNINNVFQEIRPLVQNNSASNSSNVSNTPNPFATWMRSSIHSVNSEDSHQQSQDDNRIQDATNDSTVVNIVASPSTSSLYRGDITHINSVDYVNETTPPQLGNVSNNQSHNSLQNQNSTNSDANANNNNNSNNNNTENDSSGNNPENGNSDSLTQIPEARALITTISRYFPYVCILFAKSCYDHLDGILNIFALFVVFAHSNFTLKQEVTKQSARRFIYLVRELIYIFLVVAIIGFILEKKDTFNSLFFAPLAINKGESPLALKDLLFSVCITDLILKLVTVAIKILFTMLPASAVEYKNRVSNFNIHQTENFFHIFIYFYLGTCLFDD